MTMEAVQPVTAEPGVEEPRAARRAGLRRMLHPRSIAVIGGSEAEIVARQCDMIGFAGEIWPVSRRRAEIAGRPCHARIEDLPEAPDAAFVAVPPDATVEAVRSLAAMGAGGAVCYASGFREIGPAGAARQQALVEAAGGMAVVGPNCYGALNYLDGAALWPDQHGGERVECGVAIVAQSGNISISLTMQRRGLPIGYVVSVGNKAAVGFEDFVAVLADDPRVTAIGLLIEGLDDIPAFCAAVAKAKAAGKPVVVLKAGRSEKGARATLTHTSSLAGPDRLYDALFARLGVARVHGLTAFLESLKLLSTAGPLTGNRVVSMSCSGGEASLIADIGEGLGLVFPEFDAERRAALTAVLGDQVAVANPLDYQTYIWDDRAAMTACFTEALLHEADFGLFVCDYPRMDRCDSSAWEPALAAIEAARFATGRPMAYVATLPENLPEPLQERLLAAGIVPLLGLEDALAAVAAGAAAGRPCGPAVAAAPELTGAPAVTMDEWRSKRMLAAAGLTVPEGALVASPTEAVAAAEAFGFPVAVKAVSPDLAHKSEVGAVALNLTDADAVHAAAERMAAVGPQILVERMVGGAVVELLIGVDRDPQFGAYLVIGAGGVLVELLQDSRMILLPTDRQAVEGALDALRIAPLIAGWRGKARGDRDAVTEAVLAIAGFAEAHADRLLELDVNPLMVLPEGRGVVAADALIRMTKEA